MRGGGGERRGIGNLDEGDARAVVSGRGQACKYLRRGGSEVVVSRFGWVGGFFSCLGRDFRFSRNNSAIAPWLQRRLLPAPDLPKLSESCSLSLMQARWTSTHQQQSVQGWQEAGKLNSHRELKTPAKERAVQN